MDELAREYVLSFFNKAFGMHGDKPEALRWTEEGQRQHYEALLDIAPDISGRKILDYGCGKGDLYQFLKEKGIPVNYTGYDINEQLVTLARAKHPDCEFRVFDAQTDVLTDDFDYIVLCGVFNLTHQGLGEVVRHALRTLFSHCRVGLAFNGLSAHNPRKDPELHYHVPEELFTFAVTNLSPYVSLRHDRLSYDFTLFVYREAHAFSGHE